MQNIIHTADSRGRADHGWLKSFHSFSFADYHNPERMGFGLLRVLNDDHVDPGQGFGTHPHRDMEIVSIPLAGALEHKDSEGNAQVIRHGEVQLMSAGTGVLHSEYNHSGSDSVNFLQIWVLPEKKGIAPRYDQKSFASADRQNRWQNIVSPIGTGNGSVEINQQAYFYLSDLDAGKSIEYRLKNRENGAYLFVIDGKVETQGKTLSARDAMGNVDIDMIEVSALEKAELLVIEVPMRHY